MQNLDPPGVRQRYRTNTGKNTDKIRGRASALTPTPDRYAENTRKMQKRHESTQKIHEKYKSPTQLVGRPSAAPQRGRAPSAPAPFVIPSVWDFCIFRVFVAYFRVFSAFFWYFLRICRASVSKRKPSRVCSPYFSRYFPGIFG